MTYEEIIEQIKDGLTGDSKADIAYLREQMENYKDHPMGKEILRECGRIIYSVLPDDRKDEFSRLVDMEDLKLDTAMDEVRFNIYKKDYQHALILMEDIVEKVESLEENGMFRNDAVSEYFTFNEPFEEMLYITVNDPDKEIRRSPIPFDSIYFQYGSLLIDLKRYEDANQALRKAVRWNPVNTDILFEYSESFKLLGDIEKFFEISMQAARYAFRSPSLGRCYRNFAYYFVEKKLWKEAIGCDLISLQFDPDSANAQSELFYIQQMTNGTVEQPTLDELRGYGKKYGFPIGADDTVLSLAYTFGQQSLDDGETDAARYFFEILYDLTDDEEIKGILDSLPEANEKKS